MIGEGVELTVVHYVVAFEKTSWYVVNTAGVNVKC